MSRHWVILALVVLTQAGSALMNQGLPTLFPFLRDDFHLSRTELGLFLSAIEAGALVTFVLGGWAADVFGVRKLLVLAQVLFAAMGIALAHANSYQTSLAILLFAGVALGIGSPAASLAILFWFPARRRATAMGIKQAGVPLAGMVAAALLPSIALLHGWRNGVLLIAAANMLIAVVLYFGYTDPPEPRSGAVTSRPRWAEVRALVRHRGLLVVNVYATMLFACQMSISGYLILYVRDYLGLPVVVGGFVLAMAQAGALIGRVVWGIFSDLVLRGRRVPALGLAGGVAAGLLLVLAALPPQAPMWVLLPLAVGLGFSAMGWHGLRHALVPELVPRAAAGTALGVSQAMGEAGPILGPPLFGFLADQVGYRPAWLVLAGLAAFASVLLVRALDDPPWAGGAVRAFAAPQEAAGTNRVGAKREES